MKSFVVSIFFLFISLHAQAKTLIVTDIDDTLRLTNRLKAGWLEQLVLASDPHLAFLAMPELFKQLGQNEDTEIYYVTGAVSPLDELSQNFLEQNDFPQKHNFIHKGWLNDTYDFKVKEILKIIGREKPDRILLIGDNGEYDSAAYATVATRYPNVEIYIHKLYEGGASTAVPPEQKIFITTADLAAQLEVSGDLPAESSSLVLQKILSSLEKDTTPSPLFLPGWAEITEEDVTRAFPTQGLSSSADFLLQEIKTYLYR